MKSSAYKKVNAQWRTAHDKRFDPELRERLLYGTSSDDQSIPGEVRSHLDQARSIKKSLVSNGYILSYPQQMTFLSNAAWHENAAHGLYCNHLEREMDSAVAQTKIILSKKGAVVVDGSIYSGNTTDEFSLSSFSDSSSQDGCYFGSAVAMGSRSSTIVSDDLNDEEVPIKFNFTTTKNRLNALLSKKYSRDSEYASALKKQKEKEKLATLLDRKLKKDSDNFQILQKEELERKRVEYEKQVKKAAPIVQAVARGFLVRKNLAGIQQQLRNEKEKKLAIVVQQQKDEAARLEKERKKQVLLKKKQDVEQAVVEQKKRQQELQKKKQDHQRLQEVEDAQALKEAYQSNLLQQQKKENEEKERRKEKIRQVVEQKRRQQQEELLEDLRSSIEAIFPSMNSNNGIESVAQGLLPIVVDNMKEGGINPDFVEPLALQSIIQPHLRTIDDEFSSLRIRHPKLDDNAINDIVNSLTDSSFASLKIINDRMNLNLTHEQLLYLVRVGQRVDYAMLFCKYRDASTK